MPNPIKISSKSVLFPKNNGFSVSRNFEVFNNLKFTENDADNSDEKYGLVTPTKITDSFRRIMSKSPCSVISTRQRKLVEKYSVPTSRKFSQKDPFQDSPSPIHPGPPLIKGFTPVRNKQICGNQKGFKKMCFENWSKVASGSPMNLKDTHLTTGSSNTPNHLNPRMINADGTPRLVNKFLSRQNSGLVLSGNG